MVNVDVEQLKLAQSTSSHSVESKLRLRFTKILVCIFLAPLAAGCESMRTVGANFTLDVQVKGRDAAGVAWQATPAQIADYPSDALASSPFPHKQYLGKNFNWVFSVGASGIGGGIRNLKSLPVCFRFDEAKLTSNMNAKPTRLQVSQVISNKPFDAQTDPRLDQKLVPLGILRPNKGDEYLFTPPTLCFAAEKQGGFHFAIDLSALFPSGHMFNVSWANDKLVGTGVGNWLKMTVPIEYEGKREEIEVTLVATDSRLSISYH